MEEALLRRVFVPGGLRDELTCARNFYMLTTGAQPRHWSALAGQPLAHERMFRWSCGSQANRSCYLHAGVGTAQANGNVAGALGPFAAQLLAKLDAGERLGAMSAPDLRAALQHALPPSSRAELLPPPDAVSSASFWKHRFADLIITCTTTIYHSAVPMRHFLSRLASAVVALQALSSCIPSK